MSVVASATQQAHVRFLVSIVQISSMGGQISMPGFGAYCAAKFALEGLSDALAAEVAPHGISVLIVELGAFATSFGAGRSQVSPDSGHYDDTVGPQRAAVAGMDGSQPGDPAKAATAILRAIDEASPPRRLALAPTRSNTSATHSTRDEQNSTNGHR